MPLKATLSGAILSGPSLSGIAVAAMLVGSPADAAAPIVGRWVTYDRAAVIRIDHCGPSLCGVVERVLDPRAPRVDLNNPDPAQRTRSLVGTTVLTGFREAGAEWAGGQAYDPKAGRSYRSRLQLASGNRLKVTGCILFVCRTFFWQRAT